jgi:hypothetical protein
LRTSFVPGSHRQVGYRPNSNRKNSLPTVMSSNRHEPERRFTRRLRSVLLVCRLAPDESRFQHLLVTEPQIGDIGGAEPKNIFESPPDFFESEVHANALEQFD